MRTPTSLRPAAFTLAAALPVFAMQTASAQRVKFEFPMDTYTQEVKIEFAGSQAAGRASVAMATLYDGREWAFTGRWDDNNFQGDMQMRDLFDKHGHKATWYLTQTSRNFGPEQLKQLLKGGHAVAGHSLTHPWIVYQSRNRIFEELAGIRVDLEAASDSPVVSFGFSFLAMRGRIDGTPGQVDIAKMLERAGYYHLCENWFNGRIQSDFVMTPWMPADGQPIDDYIRSSLANKSFHKKHPCMAFSMHAGRSAQKWARLEGELRRYGGKPEWWYCTLNEYAAYRWQTLKSSMTRPRARGKTLTFKLTRPVLIDLNDAIPLTFEVRGVPYEAVKGVKSATAECRPAERRALRPTSSGRPEGTRTGGGVFRFHVYHDRDQGLPARIGLVHNRENRSSLSGRDRDADLPGLRALLHYGQRGLQLTIDNRGARMTDVRITYRLPLAFKEGVVRKTVGAVAARKRHRDTLRCARSTRDYKYLSGSSFFVAQIDFVRGKRHGRLYACCNVDNREVDGSFPQGNFLRLGPISDAELDLKKIAMLARTADINAATRALGAMARSGWTVDEGGTAPPFLGPEVIKTTGRWYTRDPAAYYILRARVVSAAAQSVGFEYVEKSIRHVFLNGREVKGRSTLAAGVNILVLVYRSAGPGAGGEKAGCFLRLTSGRPGERLVNVRFEAK